MRRLFCLMLLCSLTAQNLPIGESRHPEVVKPFYLTYRDIEHLDTTSFQGNILVEFTVNKKGKVVRPNIIDTFNIRLNSTIIDKVMCLEFEPALQNGKPVEVKYKLPILFK
mgnify:FL=1